MSLGKRLISGSPPPPSQGVDPSGITTSTSTIYLTGGTYKFVDFYIDKANGDKFYYIRNGGFDASRISTGQMTTAFNASTASTTGSSTNYSIGYYAGRIAGKRDGSLIITSGYQNSDNNRYISEWTIGTSWSVPSSYSNPTSRANAAGGVEILILSDDGTKLYYNGGTNLLQNDLSTTFDISTQSYSKTLDLNSVTTDTIVAWPNNGWRIVNADWFVGGLTLYVLLNEYVGGVSGDYRIKAYDTTTAFDIANLTDRGNSKDYDCTSFFNGGDPYGKGFCVSDLGHFVIAEQDVNNGNQNIYVLS